MIDRRTVVKMGALAAAPVPGAPAPPRLPWYKNQPRVFLLDFQMPDPLDQGVPGMPRFFEKLDPERIVAQVAAANSNVLLVHAKCNQGNAYYNSKIVHKHSGLGSRDLMADFSRLCRRRGLSLLFYVQLSRERRSFLAPERRAVGADGRPVLLTNDNPLLASREERPVVCMNGPHRQYIKDILAELSGNYDFDGFWLDCFGWWARVNPCYCESCKTAYRRATGKEIPRPPLGSAEGRAYAKWRRELNSRILKELSDHIRSVNPKLTVTHNGAGLAGGSDWDVCDGDDYVSQEFHITETYGGLSLLCERNRAYKPEAPFEIEIWRFANRPGGARSASRDYQVRGADALLTEMSAVAAHGGFPQYYDQVRPDGSLEERSLAALQPAFEEVAARQPWSGVGRRVPYALVLWSKATECSAPGEARSLHASGLKGCHHALMEKRVPVELVSERDVAAGRFRGARVVLIDSAECLPEACLAPLESFVRDGGGLVVTGRTSLRNGDGALRRDFALAAVAGVNYQGMTEHWYSFVNLERKHALTGGLPLNFPMSVYQTLQTRTKTQADAEVIGTIVNPLRGFHMGYPPHERTQIPALVARGCGKGRVVYAAAPLGSIYARTSHTDTRQLIVNAAIWAAGVEPPISAVAPETVETVLWRDEPAKRTIVHLLNRTGAGLAQGEGASMHEAIPVHDVRIRLARGLAAGIARTRPGGRVLRMKTEGEWTWIDAGRLGIWEVIEIS
ncbi:MAG: family 10 glycosylhydrolase [Bryobacteraceae bacterium]